MAPYAFALRHAVTGAFAAGVLGGCLSSLLVSFLFWPFAGVLAIYFVLAAMASVQQGRRYGSAALAFALPPCFFLFHLLHGLGVLRGLMYLCVGRAPVQKTSEPWPGANRFRAWPLAASR